MSARYAPLPNPRSAPDAERELDDAFESDNDDDQTAHSESTPFTRSYTSSERAAPPPPLTIPGAYDFEHDYDYDYPPPGSPPVPTAHALPNNYGNSNGLLPSSPPRPPSNRPSFFRRAVGALLPQHYMRVPTEPEASARPRGGGLENDGVFANVMAKPGRAVPVRSDNGETYMVPEDVQKDAPPSYREAQADAVPQYWETTVHAPMSPDDNADMIVDDLPTGSVFFFISTLFISYFFQFVGFLLTYLLHSSHASKYGSRAGLGLTLIQYGFYSRREQLEEAGDGDSRAYWNTTTGMPVIAEDSNSDLGTPYNSTTDSIPFYEFGVSSRDWLAFLLMTLGWFLLLSSLVGFYRVKRWEMSIRAANRPPPTPEELESDSQFRRHLAQAFGVFDFAEETETTERHDVELDAEARSRLEAETRLANDLRAAGLL